MGISNDLYNRNVRHGFVFIGEALLFAIANASCLQIHEQSKKSAVGEEDISEIEKFYQKRVYLYCRFSRCYGIFDVCIVFFNFHGLADRFEEASEGLIKVIQGSITGGSIIISLLLITFKTVEK